MRIVNRVVFASLLTFFFIFTLASESSVLLSNFDGSLSTSLRRPSPNGGAIGDALNKATESMTTVSTAIASATNIALASAGAVASASSTFGTGFEPAAVVDGRRPGATLGAGGAWADGTPGSFPDWIQVDFPTSHAISQVNVFSLQDDYAAQVDPTSTQMFTWYGLRDFQVQYYTGTAWATVPGATITGNNLVWRAITFSPVTTQKIRVLITGTADGSYSRVTEIEVYATDTPPPSGANTNVALASAGAVASASSTFGTGFEPGAVIDGKRPGATLGAGGAWADSTPGSFPDWIQVDFPASHAISQVNVFSLQDNYAAQVEPTSTQMFTWYGLRDFQVQYWTGTAWATVPGATITGNNLVWRAITFSPVTTQKIRVLITGTADGSYSRVTEIEVYATDTPPPSGASTNVALASAGAVVSASSTFGAGFEPAAVIDGKRKGATWGAGGAWADGTPGSFADWIQVDFPTSRAISQVNVFSLQDEYGAPVEPTSTQMFTWYGVRDFQVQYYTGTAWATVPGATITGNSLVWRAITFSLVTTQKIRVLITGTADGSYSRVTEIEVYATDTPPPSGASTNLALASAGAVASASSTFGTGFGPAAVIDGKRPGATWGAGGAWADGTPGSFPDWIQVDFPTSHAISQVNVFSLQDNYSAPVEPTSTQMFTWYGLRDFQVQYWTGTAWATVPGATITGNNLVWRAITFSPVTTQKIRVLITGTADGYHSLVTEIEVYATTPTVDTGSLNSRVLVVYNTAVPDSLAVADYYMQKRAIPAENKCAIHKTGNWEWFNSLEEYYVLERDPIRTCLEAVGPQNILYIVFSYGTPFKMLGGSTDQLIADIWDGQPADTDGRVANPYYTRSESAANSYQPGVSFAEFRRSSPLIYSVWRLDAPTSALAKGLVDQALQVEGSGGLNGRGCFDSLSFTVYPDTDYAAGDWDIFRAAQMFANAGFPVVYDTNPQEFGTPPAPLRCEGAAFYTGWYSLHYNDAFSWNPGAIGWHLDSLSALSPHTPDNWAGGALGRGIAVTTGAIDEPFLGGLPHADGALRNLFEGMNVGDAIFRNTARIRWMIINIGDPLYRPFPGGRPLP